jgi:hypothetical protein
MLKAAAKFLGWLSGALAGGGAVLYSLGHLVMLGQHHLMGLGPLLEYSHRYYLQRGANFLFDIVTFRPDLMFHGLVFAVFASGLLAALLIASTKLVASRRIVSEGFPQRINRWRELFNTIGKPIVYALLLLLSFSCSFSPLQLSGAPLQVTGLLFRDPTRPAVQMKEAACHTGAIEQAILDGNRSILEECFLRILGAAFVSVVLLLLARQITRGWRWRSLAVAPFALVALIYLILLPVDYGVLMPRTEYHLARLTTDKGSIQRLTDSPLYLLAATERAFVFWDADLREVVWVPHGEIKQLDILPKRPIPLKTPNLEQAIKPNS